MVTHRLGHLPHSSAELRRQCMNLPGVRRRGWRVALRRGKEERSGKVKQQALVELRFPRDKTQTFAHKIRRCQMVLEIESAEREVKDAHQAGADQLMWFFSDGRMGRPHGGVKAGQAPRARYVGSSTALNARIKELGSLGGEEVIAFVVRQRHRLTPAELFPRLFRPHQGVEGESSQGARCVLERDGIRGLSHLGHGPSPAFFRRILW